MDTVHTYIRTGGSSYRGWPDKNLIFQSLTILAGSKLQHGRRQDGKVNSECTYVRTYTCAHGKDILCTYTCIYVCSKRNSGPQYTGKNVYIRTYIRMHGLVANKHAEETH